MNKWDCGEPGCKSSAVGAGGAIGLRAIGWSFEPGAGRAPFLRCPAHRPDPIQCVETDNKLPCPSCAGELEAALMQALIALAAVVEPVAGADAAANARRFTGDAGHREADR